MAVVHTDILLLVKNLTTLSASLPLTVGIATKEDKIYSTLLRVNEGDTFQTFNRIFDILFKEDNDCRNEHGRLRYVLRGKYGMDKICAYLNNVPWSEPNIPHDLVKIKLDRLLEELTYLTKNTTKDAQKGAKGKAATTSTAGSKKPSKSKTTEKARKKAKLTPGGPTQQLLNAIYGQDETSPTDDDEDFQPPKNPRQKSEEPLAPYTLEEDGLEAELGDNEQRKRKKVIHSSEESNSSSDSASDKSTKKKMKEGKKKPRKKAKTAEIKVADVSTEEENNTHAPNKKGPANTSRMYFKDPVPVTINHKRRWEFQCRHCSTSLTFKRSVDKEAAFEGEPTQPPLGNLATHLKTKHAGMDLKAPPPTTVKGELRGVSAASAKIMENFLKDGELNPALERTQKGFYSVFASWILEDDLPFTTGETSGIKRLFTYLQSRFMLPADTTVRNTLARIFAELHGTVKSELKNVKSKIACSTDTWTTRSMMFTFAGTIASWVTEDWELVERVIDFHPIVDKEHEGEFAAKGMAKALSDMGVLEKISSISLDNAKTNDVLLRTLSRLLIDKYGIQFVPDNAQIRCLAHVVNLVVQKILAVLDEADDPELNDYYEMMKDLPVHYDADNDEALKEFENEKDDFSEDDWEDSDDELMKETEATGETSTGKKAPSTLQKLRSIVTKISSSPQRRHQFRSIATRVYKDEKHPDTGSLIAGLMVIRDVKTRWNYTHAMIKRALILQKAIRKWVLSYDLQDLVLQPDQWTFLEKLGAMLGVFTHVTFQMSHSKTPTLPWVLPMYAHMEKHLKALTEDQKLLPSLRGAAAAGLQKLDQYHIKARNCQYNVIATMLHPYLGVSWFRKIDTTGHRAEMAKTLFKHAYEGYKSAEPVPEPVARKLTASSSSFLDEICMADDSDPDEVPTSMPTIIFDELERYLQAGRIFGRGDPDGPLLWWKTHERDFPVISKMARDFLAIPGTSVAVERLFSKSRHLCGELRSSLKAHTITEAMLSKCWIKDGIFDKVLRNLL